MDEAPDFLDGKTAINELSDEPFSQSRGDCLLTNGTDITANVSPIALSGAFTLDFESTRASTVEAWAFSDSNGTGRFVYNSPSFSSPDRLAIVVGGNFKSTGTNNPAIAAIPLGATMSMGAIRNSSNSVDFYVNDAYQNTNTNLTGTFNVDTIFHPNTDAAHGRYFISNDATGDTYEWLFNNVIDLGNGQGYVPNSGSVGDVAATPLDEQFNGSTTMAATDVDVTYPSDGIVKLDLLVASSGRGLRKSISTEIGALYRIRTRRTGGSAQSRVRWLGGAQVFTSDEFIEIYHVATATSHDVLLLIGSNIIGNTIEHDYFIVEKVNGALINNYDPATDTQFVVADSDAVANKTTHKGKSVMYGCEINVDAVELELGPDYIVPTWLGAKTIDGVTPVRRIVRCGVLKLWLDDLGLPDFTPTKVRTFATEEDYVNASQEADYTPSEE